MSDTSAMSQKWQSWFSALPQQQRDDLMAAWDNVDCADVQMRHGNAAYARRAKLMALSVAIGYAP